MSQNNIKNMVEDCTESCAATSSYPPNLWADVHATSLSSWSHNTNPWNPQNPISNSSGEEDVSISTSFTNVSNHSALSVDSPRQLAESASTNNNKLMRETASDNHIWSHVLLSGGSSGELKSNPYVGEKLLNALSTKNLSTGLMFEPACDYLKKMDNGWEFASSTSFNNFDKNFNNVFNESVFEGERLNKLSNLVSNWSIAPPDPQVDHQLDPQNMKYDSYSCYGDVLKVETNEKREIEASGDLLENGVGYQTAINYNSTVGDNAKYYCGIMPDVPRTNGRNFADILTFTSLSKPLVDINTSSKPMLKTLNLSDCKKQALKKPYPPTISSFNTQTKCNRRGQGIANEGKKKRYEENSFDIVLKKPKHDTSTASPANAEFPKPKIADKITALQQMVSPFGKTDRASVLGEAIGYIKFLQQQVQLLTDPYMKTNARKDPWGGLDRKDRGDVNLDLKSQGLCLVPTSCTPPVYRENTGSDYWTPAYRGCLYR